MSRPSSASSSAIPASLRSRRSSSESASSTVTLTVRVEPPSRPTSRRTRSSLPTIAHQLREHAVHRVGIDERHPHTVETAERLVVDQLDSLLVERSELGLEVVDLVGDVMHA